MSILNDRRRYCTDEEREEWKREVKQEYAREQYEHDHPDELYVDEMEDDDESE